VTPFAHPPHPHPQPPEKKMITCPRAGALAALDHLDGTDRTLDAVLDDMAPVIHGLSRRDRALFNHLVFGVLRWRLRLDAVIDAHANRPLNRITPTILNIIRIGLYQIQFMDRIPASAAVNTAVGLAKNRQSARAAGFVNALLRNALRNPQRYRAPDAESSPAAHMAAMKSFPRWLVFRWIQRYGIDTAGSLCDAMNTIPPITIRCNLLKNSVTELFDTLKPQVERIVILDDIPCALSLDHPQTPISEMPAFVDGRFAVQDGAAQLISMLLAPQPGETVLDACAGLGGKTTHLAQIMQDQGAVVALDHVGAKLARLEAESHRLGTTMVSTRCADLNRPNDPGGRFPGSTGSCWMPPARAWACCAAIPTPNGHPKKRISPGLPGGRYGFSTISPRWSKKRGCWFLPSAAWSRKKTSGGDRDLFEKPPKLCYNRSPTIEEKTVRSLFGSDGFLRSSPHPSHGRLFRGAVQTHALTG
jgi:16S rRNA (cytosine967-C5)-methyltransferase